MKLKNLESILQDVDDFGSPKTFLEQYFTNPHIASRMVYTAFTNSDIDGKTVLDLGSGTGILGIGAAVCGAEWVLGLEIDEAALEIASKNQESVEVENIDFVRCDISQLSLESFWIMRSNGFEFDVAILNPPFGTKNNHHLDMKFLEVAEKVFGCSVIYSLHKTTTREHVAKAAKALGFSSFEVLSEVKFHVPQGYSNAGHKKKDLYVDTDFVRLSKKQ